MEKSEQKDRDSESIMLEITMLISQLSSQCKTREEAYKFGQSINSCADIYLSFFNYKPK